MVLRDQFQGSLIRCDCSALKLSEFTDILGQGRSSGASQVSSLPPGTREQLWLTETFITVTEKKEQVYENLSCAFNIPLLGLAQDNMHTYYAQWFFLNCWEKKVLVKCFSSLQQLLTLETQTAKKACAPRQAFLNPSKSSAHRQCESMLCVFIWCVFLSLLSS